MGDSDSSQKKQQVPSWQQKLKETTPTEGDAGAPEAASRATIVEQAKKFLEEDEVRDASTDKKIAFLQGKGLKRDEINELLGVERNVEASPTVSETSLTPPQPQRQHEPAQSYATSQQQSSPPIITYPEFLTTPPHPTPLVTKGRLLTTLYLFSGLSALLYGTNTYLITPMVAQLTISRLSLAESASTNLRTLIQKLESVVSTIPSQANVHAGKTQEEVDSEDEDPTELFHRDIGVQTSLSPTPSNSRPTSPSPPITALDDQTTRLSSLSTSLSGLVEESTSEGQDVSDLSTTIGVLREYLDELAYVAPTYGYGVGGYAGVTGSGKDDDEIARVKASIRGVKGVLLSARSFPGLRAPLGSHAS